MVGDDVLAECDGFPDLDVEDRNGNPDWFEQGRCLRVLFLTQSTGDQGEEKKIFHRAKQSIEI